MPVPDPRIYLLHILDCCERLSECAVLRDEGGVPSHILLDAVCRNLEVIGKASRKIGTEMNELRNVLIHNYEGADPTLVWGIVDRQIPTPAGGRGWLSTTSLSSSLAGARPDRFRRWPRRWMSRPKPPTLPRVICLGLEIGRLETRPYRRPCTFRDIGHLEFRPFP